MCAGASLDAPVLLNVCKEILDGYIVTGGPAQAFLAISQQRNEWFKARGTIVTGGELSARSACVSEVCVRLQVGSSYIGVPKAGRNTRHVCGAMNRHNAETSTQPPVDTHTAPPQTRRKNFGGTRHLLCQHRDNYQLLIQSTFIPRFHRESGPNQLWLRSVPRTRTTPHAHKANL